MILSIIFALLFVIFCIFNVQPASGISCDLKVQPPVISHSGEVQLILSNCEFSKNLFNFGAGNEHLGNQVYLYQPWSGQKYDCVISKDGSHESQILCSTGEMAPNTKYRVMLLVDGVEVQTSVQIEVSVDPPTLTSVQPTSGHANSLIQISGRIVTELYSNAIEVGQFGQTERILRVYSGSQLCSLIQPESDKLYGIEMAKNRMGYMNCTISGNYIGYQNVSYIISPPYGRSVFSQTAYKVSVNNELYMFQSYPVVKSIFPTSIGDSGQALITIKGKFHKSKPSAVYLNMGESNKISCEPLEPYTEEEIRCKVNGVPIQSGTSEINQGNRGVTIEMWESSESIDSFTFSKDTISKTFHNPAGFQWDLVNTTKPVIVRIKAYLLITRSASHEFIAVSPTASKLKFGSDPIVYNGYRKLNLIENQIIHIELKSTSPSGKLQMKVFNSSYINEQTSVAYNDRQAIIFESNNNPEIQEIKIETLATSGAITGASETQKIQTSVSGEYCLCGYLACTDWISATDSAAAIKKKIEEHVIFQTKITAMIPSTTSYTVEFNAEFGNVPMLTYKLKVGSTGSVTVTTVQDGKTSSHLFHLAINGAVSNQAVDISNFSTTIEAAKNLMKNVCPTVIDDPVSKQYFYNFEESNYTLNESLCGFRGARNHKFDLSVSINNLAYLCMGYRELSLINLNISSPGSIYSVDVALANSTEWAYSCINLYEKVKQSVSADFLKIESITFPGVIDNVYLGTSALVQPDQNIIGMIKFNKFQIESLISEQVNDKTVKFTIIPFDCYSTLDLIEVAGTTQTTIAESKSTQWTNSQVIKSTRIQKISSPISGKYDLVFDGSKISNIDWNTELNENVLKQFPTLGNVVVTHTKSCSVHINKIHFKYGYPKPAFQLSNLKLSGEVKRSEVEINPGFLWFDPIPGDMLKSSHLRSQLTVDFFNITSACQDSCNLVVDPALTPTLTAASAVTTDSYTQVQLSGTGTKFNVDKSKNQLELIAKDKKSPKFFCEGSSVSQNIQMNCLVNYLPFGKYGAILLNLDTGKSKETIEFIQNALANSIESITPNVGPKLGGIVLTMVGKGFTNDSNSIFVKIGDNICDIKELNASLIKCILPQIDSNAATQKQVEVIQYEVSTIKANGFTYDDSVMPSISQVSPSTDLIVSGGQVITISGSNFGTDSSKVHVVIGNITVAVVNITNSQIQITSPSMKSGNYPVIVNVDNMGQASPNKFTLGYDLVVTNISPSMSSFAGGNIITLTGKGFGSSSDLIKVNFGSRECSVKAITNNQIQCTTSSGFNVHTLTLITDKLLGTRVMWNNENVNVFVGDSVIWSWDTFSPMEIYQTISVESTEKLLNRPSTITAQTKGAFKRYFGQIGSFYFFTKFGNQQRTVVVHVKERDQLIEKLNVQLSGKSAQYINSGQSFNISCKRTGCSIPTHINLDSQSFDLLYDTCVSHYLIDFFPIQINTQSSISLLFTTPPSCSINVKFQFHRNQQLICQALTQSTSNTNSYTCNVNTNEFAQQSALSSAQVSISLENLGNALIYHPQSQMEIVNIIVMPLIKSIQPTTGSNHGGTLLTITGTNLPTVTLDKITIGGVPCITQTNSTIQITCITGKLSDSTKLEQSLPIEMSIVQQNQYVECSGNCTFTYSTTNSIVVTSCIPNSVTDGPFVMTLTGSDFGNDFNMLTVELDNSNAICLGSALSGQQLTLKCPPIKLGKYSAMYLRHKTHGRFALNCIVTSEARISSINPQSGSIKGGTFVEIKGNGFDNTSAQVQLDGSGKLCQIIQMNLISIKCETPEHSQGPINLIVIINNVNYSPQQFNYDSTDKTPTITALSTNTVVSSSTLTITGSKFGSSISNVTVKFNNIIATNIQTVTPNSIQVIVPDLIRGSYQLSVRINNLGYAIFTMNSTVTMKVAITQVEQNQGSYGGMQNITVLGSGFDLIKSQVRVCNEMCTNVKVKSSVELTCLTPVAFNTTAPINIDKPCIVEISITSFTTTASGDSANLPNGFTFNAIMTAQINSISPLIGGTAGGTVVTITGTNFLATGNRVQINGSQCEIQTESATEIKCRTSSHKGSGRFMVEVHHGNYGTAVNSKEFYYIDRWSSIFTWNGMPPPTDGDLVVIPEGMTVLLDTSTPVLGLLLINGGTLIFDETHFEITLQAKYILLNNGGRLQVGTKSAVYSGLRARIILHGHQRSKELPIYGVKMIAVRNGTLDLHGKYVNVPWTKLARSSNAGSNEIELAHPVDWKVNDKIMIATTGDRNSQRETEVHEIAEIKSGNTILVLKSVLKYKKLGGIMIDASSVGAGQTMIGAEVGLLTHNVVVQGTSDDRFNVVVEACPKGFNTGQFATQTCFQGRFGEEMGSDEFGGHIIAHPPKLHSNVAVLHLSNVELHTMGQAFRLSRYPIHFHIGGDMAGSYVKRVAVYNTFNRALVVHASHNVLVEHNVFFNIKGGALFLEDGNEYGNILQYNLIVKVLQSTSLLNDDITPASFWATNPNNSIRHNAAAGGSHFGYWYRMHDHPERSSYDVSVCPKKHPLGEFRNNSAHSFGWFGIWIFPDWFPTIDGRCNSTNYQQALFDGFVSWNNEKGMECVNCGSIQFDKFILANNEKSGFEGKRVMNMNMFSRTTGPMYKNSLIIGREPLLEPTYPCTDHGLVLPWLEGTIISNLEFRNFNYDSCTPIFGTEISGTCTEYCGGFTYLSEKIKFVNTKTKLRYRWQSDFIVRDMDGTITGKAINSSIVPWSVIFPQDKCTKEAGAVEFSSGIPAAICQPEVVFRRISLQSLQNALNNRYLIVLYQQKLNSVLVNDTSIYGFKRVSTKGGWMISLPGRETYVIGWVGAPDLKNITYMATVHHLQSDEWIILCHIMEMEPDVLVNGIKSNTILNPTVHSHFTYSFDNSTKKLCILIKDKEKFTVEAYKCFWAGCKIPTDEGGSVIPTNLLYWTENKPPKSCEIASSEWVKANFTYSDHCPKLIVRGYLEFIELPGNPSAGITLLAEIIVVIGGKILAGNNSHPYQGRLNIKLKGQLNGPSHTLEFSPNIGNKAIAVFGQLRLISPTPPLVWTHLTSTAPAGSTKLQLKYPVHWPVGGEIVISSTHYSHLKNERVRITAVQNNNLDLIIEPALKYDHHVVSINTGSGQTEVLAAEVGLLTRNIIIESSDLNSATYESYGGRILVSKCMDNSLVYQGSVQLHGVELRNMGQFGYIDHSDPRFGVSVVSLKDGNDTDNFVRFSSCNNMFSPCFGVFDSNKVVLDQNVIYKTIGEGIKIGGRSHQVTNNLIIGAVWEGGHYRPSVGVLGVSSFPKWTAGLDLFDMVMTDISTNISANVIAGSERAGINMKEFPCQAPTILFQSNVIHSTMIGIHINHKISSNSNCTMISNVVIYKAYDFGIFYQHMSSLHVNNVKLLENGVGLNGFVVGPPILDHSIEPEKFVKLTNSLVAGHSGLLACDDNLDENTLAKSERSRGPRSNSNGVYGVLTGTFLSIHNHSPEKPLNNLMSYNTINGKTIVESTKFVNFAENCVSKKDFGYVANSINDDGIHPSYLQKLEFVNCRESQKIFIPRPNIWKINPSDCVDMDCDGLKKVLIHDIDGSLKSPGTYASIFSQSEWEWDGDSRRGLGYYRIPKIMETTPDNTKINLPQFYPNKGIIRKGNCNFVDSWNAYYCVYKYEMMIIESMDSDTETRRLSPVAITTDLPGNNFVDLINGPQDHGWCSGYTCQRRVSTFMSIVPHQENIRVYFSSTSPQHLRLYQLHTNDNDASIRVGIFYSFAARFDVFVNGVYKKPLNGYYSNNQLLLKEPTPNNTYMPSYYSGENGDNYFHETRQAVFVVIKRNSVIEIKSSPIIKLGFNLPSISVDDFFGAKIVENLAAFLGIPSNKIRVVKVVPETSSSARRKKRAISGSSVTLEVGYQSPENPSSTSGPTIYESYDKILVAVQTNKFSSVLQTPVSNVAISKPIPTTNSAAWNVMANSTATSTSSSTTIQIPKTYQAKIVGSDTEGMGFDIHIDSLDDKGQHVNELGGESIKFRADITIQDGTNTITAGVSYFNTNTSGWAFMRNLQLDYIPRQYIAKIAISTESNGTIQASKLVEFNFVINIKLRSFKLGITDNFASSSFIKLNSPVKFSSSVIDTTTNTAPINFNWNNHLWSISARVCSQPTYVTTPLESLPAVQLAVGSNQADLAPIIFTSEGACRVCFTMVPSNQPQRVAYYAGLITAFSRQIVVRNDNYQVPGEAKIMQITLKFPDASLANIINQLESFQTTLYNKIHFDLMKNNQLVDSRKYQFKSGSVLAGFEIHSSQESEAKSFATELGNFVTNGQMKFTFNNMTFSASAISIDNVEYSQPAADQTTLIIVLCTIFGCILVVLLVIGIWIGIRKSQKISDDDNVSTATDLKLMKFDNLSYKEN